MLRWCVWRGNEHPLRLTECDVIESLYTWALNICLFSGFLYGIVNLRNTMFGLFAGWLLHPCRAVGRGLLILENPRSDTLSVRLQRHPASPGLCDIKTRHKACELWSGNSFWQLFCDLGTLFFCCLKWCVSRYKQEMCYFCWSLYSIKLDWTQP